MVNEQYKERLSDWVKGELERTRLSERQLSDRIGVSYSALQRWRKKLIKQELVLESIEALARYLGKTPEEIRAWLDGRVMPTEDPLLVEIRDASIGSLIAGLKAIAYRLEALQEGEKMSCSIAALIQQAFSEQDAQIENREDFLEFFRCAPFEPEDEDRIRKIALGQADPEEDDIPDLALALEYFTGRSFPVGRLLKIWRGENLGCGNQV